MAIFILVHGAFHGGWCWQKLTPILTAQGHQVLAPDLPGMGLDPLHPAEATLGVYACSIADLARRQSERPILVGHSLGGLTISVAAEAAPDALAGLVYLAAVLVADGGSAMALSEGDAASGVAVSPDGLSLLTNEDYARQHFFSDCDEVDVCFALARLKSQPVRPMIERMELSDGRYGRVPRAYIECSADAALPLAQQRSMQAALPCNPIFMLPTGHSPFLQAPDALAAHLFDIAELWCARIGPHSGRPPRESTI